MPADTATAYQQRLHRYVTALYNQKPDRVPIRIFSEEFSAKYCGYSNFETAVDLDLQFDVNRQFAVETGIDAVPVNSIVNWFGMQKALGWEGILYPGIGLPRDAVNAWHLPDTEEGAYLKVGEYDAFNDDPTRFLIETWLPRFSLPMHPGGEPVTFEHNMAFINGIMAYNNFFGTWGAKQQELIDAGVVPAVGSVLKAPLDILGDKLRGYVNLCYDLVDHREKVIEACEALMPHLLNLVLGGADPDRHIPSIIWMHRGCVPYISHADFNEIYWPTLKPIVEELWTRGHQIVLYAEGDWTMHLDSVAELPENSVIFHCDKTDIVKAGEVLGKKFCLSGGIPNELLTIGTQDDVRSRCKTVIDTLAQDGGYIMDASALLLNDAKIENVKAMIDFSLDYGTYSRSDTAGRDLSSIVEEAHAGAQGSPSNEKNKKPAVCIPWEDKKKELPSISGDEEKVKKVWEDIDSRGYVFAWVNLTW